MLKNNHGHIVNIASSTGLVGMYKKQSTGEITLLIFYLDWPCFMKITYLTEKKCRLTLSSLISNVLLIYVYIISLDNVAISEFLKY